LIISLNKNQPPEAELNLYAYQYYSRCQPS
jgi:hypothetical protein